MQVILLDKVINLGNLGEIVKVKDGYARNFLIPQGRARRATEANKAEFEAKRIELEKAAAGKLAASQAEGEKLAGTTVKLTQKAGVDACSDRSPTSTSPKNSPNWVTRSRRLRFACPTARSRPSATAPSVWPCTLMSSSTSM